jgi:hypothetical protein
VVSFQKQFLKTNGAQISDLVRFEGSKCVHVSNLKVSGSRVFKFVEIECAEQKL